ncbi:MAG: hypothetical protein ACMUJM_20400 [bacterium]
MASSKIEIIGIYQVPYTDELYRKAYQIKYEGISIPFWKKGKIKKALKEELSSIVLIEVFVKNPDNNFDVGDFGQPGIDQAPYEEVFLNSDGTELISRGFDVPKSNELRIAFYLHFFDPARPLKTSYKELICPSIRDIPDRLKQLISYVPCS